MESSEKITEILQSEELLESLARIEHERWSHWQRYMHAQCITEEDGALVIPGELVRRWSRQMSTAYDDLSEKEKESDREQVGRYLPTIVAAVREHLGS